jgi:hypothetical protein
VVLSTLMCVSVVVSNPVSMADSCSSYVVSTELEERGVRLILVYRSSSLEEF